MAQVRLGKPSTSAAAAAAFPEIERSCSRNIFTPSITYMYPRGMVEGFVSRIQSPESSRHCCCRGVCCGIRRLAMRGYNVFVWVFRMWVSVYHSTAFLLRTVVNHNHVTAGEPSTRQQRKTAAHQKYSRLPRGESRSFAGCDGCQRIFE